MTFTYFIVVYKNRTIPFYYIFAYWFIELYWYDTLVYSLITNEKVIDIIQRLTLNRYMNNVHYVLLDVFIIK